MLSTDADSVLESESHRPGLHHAYREIPVIAEVIAIGEQIVDLKMCGEPDTAFVSPLKVAPIVQFGLPELHAIDGEKMKVKVPPEHQLLDHLMNFGQRNRFENEYPAPHRWLELVQTHPQLQNVGNPRPKRTPFSHPPNTIHLQERRSQIRCARWGQIDVTFPSSRILVCQLATSTRTEIVTGALAIGARTRHGQVAGVIFHGELSPANAKVITLCEKFHVERSMGETGSCCHHDSAESFGLIFTHEYFYRHAFVTVEELRVGVADDVNFYNHQRRCQKAGGVSPIRYELSLARLNHVAETATTGRDAMTTSSRERAGRGNNNPDHRMP